MDTSFWTNECHYDTYGDVAAAVTMAAQPRGRLV
jgi:hypothetical protein